MYCRSRRPAWPLSLLAVCDDDRITKVFAGLDFDASGAIDADEFRKAYMIHPSMRTAPGLGGVGCAN